MKYGEMKTSFRTSMDALKVESNVFDFAENFDAAQFFFAINLPAETIPELLTTSVSNVSPFAIEERIVSLPGDYLKVESVTLAKERVLLSSDPDVYGAPINLPATIVSQRDYLIKSQFSQEPVVAFFNGSMYYNPDLPPELANYAGPIRMVYRRIPNTFIRNVSNSSTGLLITGLVQDSEQPRLIKTVSPNTWSGYGLTTENLSGGKFIVVIGSGVYIYDVDYAWDDVSDGSSGLHIKESSVMIPVSGGVFGSAFVAERQSIYNGTESYFVDDFESPEFSKVYHQVMLDYAKARFLFTRQPEVAQSLMNMVFQTFQALGVNVKIEFGGESE